MPTAKQIKDEIKRLEKIENGKLEVDTIKDLEFNLIRLRLAKAELKGFQAGEISKHKSDLQQELVYWNERRARSGHVDDNSNAIKDRINFIKKELEELEK